MRLSTTIEPLGMCGIVEGAFSTGARFTDFFSMARVSSATLGPFFFTTAGAFLGSFTSFVAASVMLPPVERIGGIESAL